MREFLIEKMREMRYIYVKEVKMIVIPYNDFFENPSLYQKKAELFGLKILPKKSEKKVSKRTQKKLDALNAVVGIIPSNVNLDSLLAERRMSK